MDEQKLETWLAEHTDWQKVGMDVELPSYVRMYYSTVTQVCRHLLYKMRDGDFE